MTRKENNRKESMGAIILAGGDSKRLGCPKALLDFEGQSLIEMLIERLKNLFREITVVTDRPDLFQGLPVKLTGDLLTDHQKSPLRGIHAGLSVSSGPFQFVVACDMPLLNMDLISFMSKLTAEDIDVVIPLVGGHYQPLHAFYNRSCIKVITNQLRNKQYKVAEIYRHLKLRVVEEAEVVSFDPKQESFTNINRWSDYHRVLKVFTGSEETIH